MPFQLRVTETPPLNQLLALEQIVVVDKTGPALPIGPSVGAVCLVAEWLKGPFIPSEVGSTGQILSNFGNVSLLLSQSIAGTQDGSGQRFEGNGWCQLRGKKFQRLVLQRVDTDMVNVDGGTAKRFIKFTVYIEGTDEDPLTAGITGREILIPAGTRFAEGALSTNPTTIIALSQDIIIPKGTVINVTTPPTGYVGRIVVSYDATATTPSVNLFQDPDTGKLTLVDPDVQTNPKTGATAFFVKGITAAIAFIDTCIDTTLPNSASIITNDGAEPPQTINASNAAAAVFAPGVVALTTLQDKIDTLYADAISKTLPTGAPQEDITVIWAARRGSRAGTTPGAGNQSNANDIRVPLLNNAISSSQEGRGRIAVVSGPRVESAGTNGDALSVTGAKSMVMGTGTFSTGTVTEGSRSDRKIVAFPYMQVFIPEFGKVIDLAPDGFMAATLSNFPAEKNPGARNANIQAIQDFESEYAVSPLVRQDYINFKAKGVAALKRDRAAGWWFQSGITSVDPLVDQAKAPIKRRRMADEIQDSIAAIGSNYNKEPATQDRVDQMVGEIDAYLLALRSPPNPANKRIELYAIDAESGNSPELVALGIFTVIVKVRLLASMDTLVFETTIGETVEIEPAA